MISYALAERLHGHLALLGLAVLLHPVITLRVRRGVSKRMQLSADLGALLLVLPYIGGLLLYPAYRANVKKVLLLDQPAVAAGFESKEHLAAMAVALAIGGALTLRASGTDAGRRTARALLFAGWVCGFAAAILGLWVASSAHPAP